MLKIFKLYIKIKRIAFLLLEVKELTFSMTLININIYFKLEEKRRIIAYN